MDTPEGLQVGDAKVTLNSDGSAAPGPALTAAPTEFTISDARGRAIQLKKPGVLAQFRLVEALGEVAQNQVYMGMVLPLIFVVAIDGEPVVQPASKAEVEALIARLDEDGIEAVMTAVQAKFGIADEGASKNG